MNRFVLLFFLGVSLVSEASEIAYFGASDEIVSGSMDCKVKTNYIITMVDGMPEKYSGYSDHFEVGDPLLLEYLFSKKSGWIRFGIMDNVRPDVTGSMVMARNVMSREDFKYFTGTAGGDGAAYTNKFGSLWFGSESIRLVSTYYNGPDARLVMKRYYKGDWHGIGTLENSDSLASQTYTFDCRPIVDNIDTIFNLMKKMFKK